ncbi:MAG: UDP-N-acetylmuramoyl-tripeptide--D-alanyl-D-alanine ligase [Candidatus Marinimicrobia bacterium]|nr:UDP-N-acetylmuramoyl-tripeptide--D-alanyl-D-alanine ligase [Candidatus Neomarinimicrobiota bacterium]
MSTYDPKQLAAWSHGHWDSQPPPRLTGVTQDSRQLTPGALYIALRGPRHDGHQFVAQAFTAGAGAVLIESAYRGACPGPALRVADTHQALWALAAGQRRTFTGRCVGITGSVGKTTVKELMAALFSAGGPVAKSPGNWNNDIGLPLSLLNADPAAWTGLFELGINHPGEMAPLAKLLQPDWALITDIGPSHIEFFPSETAIAEEKAELFRALRPRDSLACFAADSPYGELLAAAAPGPTLTIALDDTPADLQGRVAPDGQTLHITERGGATAPWACPLPLPGRHTARNLLYAVALARAGGLEPAALREALRHFKPVGPRWQVVEHQGLTLINDAYNANPLSMRAALEACAETYAAHRPCWLVLGDMLELGSHAPRAHLALGELVATGPWQGLVTVGPFARQIAAGARAGGFPADQISECATAADAGRLLRHRLPANAVALFKASRALQLETALDFITTPNP